MTKIIRFVCNVLPFFALAGKVSAENKNLGLFGPFPDWHIEYKSLLHPPLGETPAIWLATQSLLVELMGTFEPIDYGFGPDMSPVGRLPGERAGGYLAALLIPEYDVQYFLDHPKNSTLLYPARICKEIAGSMVAKMKKVPQTSDVLEFGANYIFGNGFITGFSKSVCKTLYPEIVKTMMKSYEKKKTKNKIDQKKFNTALNAGFNKLTNALLLSLGTHGTDTARFVSQLEARLRYIDRSRDLERTYGRLLSDFTSQQTQFASIAAHQPGASKSLREFNKLSCNALSRLPHRDSKINLAQWHETENATAMVGMFAELSIKSLEFATPFGGKIAQAAESAIMSMTKVLNAFRTVPYSILNGRSLNDSKPGAQLTRRKRDVPVTVHESQSSLPPVSSTSFYSAPRMASHPSTTMKSATFETAIANSEKAQPSPTAAAIPQDIEPQPTPALPTPLAKRPPFFVNFWNPHPILEKYPTRTVIATQPTPGNVMPTPLDAAQLAQGIRLPGFGTVTSIKTVTALPTLVRTMPRLEVLVKSETVTVTATTTMKVTKWNIQTKTDYQCTRHG